VLRDVYSPLWMIRCVEPCRPDGWCQGREDERGDRTTQARWLCFLGSGRTRGDAVALARRNGHEVVE